MKALTPIPRVINDDAFDISNEDEAQFWPRIMWADCGAVSGVAVIWFHPLWLMNPRLSVSQSILAHWGGFLRGNEDEQAREMLRLAAGLGGPNGLAVGFESFIVQRVLMQDDFLSSPRIAAKLRFALWMGIKDYDGVTRRRSVFQQSPSEAQVGDKLQVERLKRLGLWTPGGEDHVRDATQHALLHLKKVAGNHFGMQNFKAIYGWDPAWEEA